MANRPYFQPHYPCTDANPNKQMTRTPFAQSNGPFVFWADVPSYDYTVNLMSDGEEFPPFDYSPPTTWPKRHSLIRVPRCVRYLGQPYSGSPTDIPSLQPFLDQTKVFVQQMHALVQSIDPSIYFQYYPTGLEGTLGVPNVAAFNTEDDMEGKRSWPDLDLEFLDQCVLFGDVLNIVSITSGVADTFIATDDTTLLFYHNTWAQLVEYHAKQYPKQGKAKTILQDNRAYIPYNAATSGDPAESAAILNARHNYLIDLVSSDMPQGWEFGENFSFDASVYEPIIREFWSL